MSRTLDNPESQPQDACQAHLTPPMTMMPTQPLHPFPLPDTDAIKAKPTAWWALLLQFAIGGVFGLLAVTLGLRVVPLAGLQLSPMVGGITVALGMLVGGWLHFVLHELGHAVAGRLVGLRLVAMGVGPWRLLRDQSGQWRGQRSRGLAGVGGFAVVVPQAGQTMSHKAESVLLLGGALANLVFGALGLGLASSGWLGGYASIWLALFGMVGLAIGAFNLLPLRSAGWHHDGRALLDLWRGHADALAGHHVRQLVGLYVAGVRPRDWSPHLLPDPTTISDERLRVQAESLLLSVAMDRDDIATAAASARRLVQHWARQGDGVRQLLAMGIAAHIARFEPDVSTLRAWREQGEAALIDQSAILAWLDAEIAALDNSPDEARRWIALAREALPRCSFALEAMLLEEDLQQLEARLLGHAHASPAVGANIYTVAAPSPLAESAS